MRSPSCASRPITGSSRSARRGWGSVAGTAVCAIRFRPSWTVWMAGNWLLITSTGFVLSVPRYALVLFPLFAWFAVLPDRWRWVVGALSVAGLVYFAGRFAMGQ